VILPFTLLRRLECVLEPTKAHVLEAATEHVSKPEGVRERLLLRAADQPFFNASPLTLGTLSDTQTADDLMSYVQSFSADAREIFEHFNFEDFVQQLSVNNLLYQVVQRFASMDLSPQRISNFGMGSIFEELIRKFAESSNETAGEHFTPRDVVHLTTSLVLTGQDHKLKPHSIVTVYDPTAGTGGFLSESDEYIQQVSENVTVSLHGQELNPESYAICKADMLIKGQQVENIKLGAPQMKAVLNALSERDPEAELCTDSKGNPEPDTSLRDNENVPLTESVYDRHFYVFNPARPLEEIDADLKECTDRIKRMIEELSA